MLHYGGQKTADALAARRTADDIRGMTELDVLKQHHKFVLPTFIVDSNHKGASS